MMKAHLSVIAIVTGIALVAGSLLWPRLFVTTWAWDQEQAQQYREAGLELHRLSHQHGGEGEGHGHNSDDDDTELAAARERYEQMAARLETARSWRDAPAAWMKWAGVSIALVGVYAQLAVRSRDD
jgi:ABC-type transport system involved in cytochrome c biogenesis permease subunit